MIIFYLLSEFPENLIHWKIIHSLQLLIILDSYEHPLSFKVVKIIFVGFSAIEQENIRLGKNSGYSYEICRLGDNRVAKEHDHARAYGLVINSNDK